MIESGQIDRAEMKRHHIAEDDLIEELRLKGIETPQEVKFAVFERSGEISVVRK